MSRPRQSTADHHMLDRTKAMAYSTYSRLPCSQNDGLLHTSSSGRKIATELFSQDTQSVQVTAILRIVLQISYHHYPDQESDLSLWSYMRRVCRQNTRCIASNDAVLGTAMLWGLQCWQQCCKHQWFTNFDAEPRLPTAVIFPSMLVFNSLSPSISAIMPRAFGCYAMVLAALLLARGLHGRHTQPQSSCIGVSFRHQLTSVLWIDYAAGHHDRDPLVNTVQSGILYPVVACSVSDDVYSYCLQLEGLKEALAAIMK